MFFLGIRHRPQRNRIAALQIVIDQKGKKKLFGKWKLDDCFSVLHVQSYFRSITAIVMRLTQTNSFFSLLILISHTCVLFPIWTGRAVPKTNPSFTLLM